MQVLAERPVGIMYDLQNSTLLQASGKMQGLISGVSLRGQSS